MAALFNCGIVVNNSQPMLLDAPGIGTMLTIPSPTSYSHEDTSSNMSTQSSSSSSPFGNLTYLAPEQDANRPYLRIIEQPVEKFRFRYKSEMMGTHGSILGRNADRVRKRTYPTVQLCNYDGEAVIRCSLYTADADESMRTPHTHRLIVRVDNEDRDDPHEVTVSPEQGYMAVFQGMGIIHTAKKHITDELLRKKRIRLLETLKLLDNSVTCLSQRNEVEMRIEAEQEAKRMNLNVVTLRFEAFARKNGTLMPICDRPVYSQPINNMKSALTGELKICRIDKYTSSCLGNEEVFILVEKVGKKNIKVRFYELDDEENEIWYDYGKFSELDVHHQYAIVFRTPPYRDTNIDKQVDVFVELYRPTDGDRSDPIRFVYKPSEMSGRTRKRARTSLAEEIPTAVVTGTVNLNPVLAQSNGIGTNGAFSNLLNDLDAIPTPPSFFEEVLNENDTNAADFEEFMKNLSLPSLSSAYCSSYDEADGVMKNGNGMKDINMMHICTDGVGNYSLKSRKSGGSSSRGDELKRVANRRGVAIPEIRSKAPAPPPSQRRELEPERFAKRALGRLTEILSDNPTPDVIVKNVIEIFSTRTQKDDNPVHCSVLYEQKSLLKQMLPILAKGSHFGIINAHNGVGLTPLHLAVMQNLPDFVKLLIKNEADPRIGTLKEGRTAVHLAVEEDRDSCLSVLLSGSNYPTAAKFPDCNALDDTGNAPIHLAARKGNLSAIKKLLEMGAADINIKDKSHGRTVLHIAIEEMNGTVAEYILDKTKILVDETDYDGNTALHLACVVGEKGSVELCRLLLKYNANPHKTNFMIKDRKEKEKEGLDKELVEVKMEPDSEDDDDDDDDDYRLKIESEDEDEDPLESRGQSSFDLAAENKEIMELFLMGDTKQEDENITVKEEPVDVPLLDDILGEVKNGLFDELTLTEISSLLDKSGSWSSLAERLEYGFLTSSIRNASSPTRMLLNYADVQGLTTIQDIRKQLKDLNETKAVEALDRMLARTKK